MRFRILTLLFKDFESQITETVVFAVLGEKDLGPRLYAAFPGGRLEEYISVCSRKYKLEIHIPYFHLIRLCLRCLSAR